MFQKLRPAAVQDKMKCDAKEDRIAIPFRMQCTKATSVIGGEKGIALARNSQT